MRRESRESFARRETSSFCLLPTSNYAVPILQFLNSEFCQRHLSSCRKRCAVACCSDLISYEEKGAQHPGPVRSIRIC
jgi:hypothetical protein